MLQTYQGYGANKSVDGHTQNGERGGRDQNRPHRRSRRRLRPSLEYHQRRHPGETVVVSKRMRSETEEPGTRKTEWQPNKRIGQKSWTPKDSCRGGHERPQYHVEWQVHRQTEKECGRDDHLAIQNSEESTSGANAGTHSIIDLTLSKGSN